MSNATNTETAPRTPAERRLLADVLAGDDYREAGYHLFDRRRFAAARRLAAAGFVALVETAPSTRASGWMFVLEAL